MNPITELSASLCCMPIGLRGGGMIATIQRAKRLGLLPVWGRQHIVRIAAAASQEMYNAIGKGSSAKRRAARWKSF